MNRREVRSEVFLRQDIQSILRSIDAANRELAARLPEDDVECYRAGFADALRAVATAFHATLEAPAQAVAEDLAPQPLPQRRIRIIDHVPTPRSNDRFRSG